MPLTPTVTVLSICTAPSISTASKFVVPSISALPDMSKVAASNSPEIVKFLCPVVSILESVVTTLEAIAVPAVRPSNNSNSASARTALPAVKAVPVTIPVEVIAPEPIVPATVTAPSASVIKSVSLVCPIVAPLVITLSTVSVVKVPNDVIFDCAAVVTVAAVPEAFPVTSPVISPTKAVDVIEVAPVTTPASTLIVPSNKIADPAAGSKLIAAATDSLISCASSGMESRATLLTFQQVILFNLEPNDEKMPRNSTNIVLQMHECSRK